MSRMVLFLLLLIGIPVTLTAGIFVESSAWIETGVKPKLKQELLTDTLLWEDVSGYTYAERYYVQIQRQRAGKQVVWPISSTADKKGREFFSWSLVVRGKMPIEPNASEWREFFSTNFPYDAKYLTDNGLFNNLTGAQRRRGEQLLQFTKSHQSSADNYGALRGTVVAEGTKVEVTKDENGNPVTAKETRKRKLPIGTIVIGIFAVTLFVLYFMTNFTKGK